MLGQAPMPCWGKHHCSETRLVDLQGRISQRLRDALSAWRLETARRLTKQMFAGMAKEHHERTNTIKALLGWRVLNKHKQSVRRKMQKALHHLHSRRATKIMWNWHARTSYLTELRHRAAGVKAGFLHQASIQPGNAVTWLPQKIC